MHITPYTNLTALEKDNFFNFLKNESLETSQPAHANMWDDNWANLKNTLPYILEKTKRFSEGTFSIIFDDNKIIGCGGVYQSDFCSDLTLAGTRAWITKNYRNKSIIRDTLLPYHKQWSIENNYRCVALCFNEYNKNLITTFKRVRLGENSNRINERTPKHMFYRNFHEVDFPVNIQYTKQWVVYEKLVDEWNFDWNKIKFELNSGH